MCDCPNVARRSFMKGIVLLTGGATVPGLVTSMPAFGQAKAAKAATQYQEKPNGNKQCSNCLQFVPGQKPKDNGTCKVVEGSISPNGYCIVWVAKP
jgi:hypothetical protein